MRGCGFYLVLVLAARVHGAEPIEELLASTEPKQQAWGAYRAGAAGKQDAVPALRRLLAVHCKGRDGSNDVVRETVVDALIRLKAKIPWKELRPVFASDKTEALVLLAQHPKANQAALLDVMDHKLSDLQWLLVCNLLAAQRAPSFAAYLLFELEMTLEIRVVDKGAGGMGRGGGRALGGFGDGRLTVSPGWPPRAHYTLSKYEFGTRRLVAPGKYPVYFQRTEVKTGTGGIGGSSARIDRNGHRLEYLAQLLGMRRIGLRVKYYAVIEWQDQAGYIKAAWEAHQRIYRAFEGTVESLRDLELLTESEAKGARPELSTRIDDYRKVKQPPLPRLPG